VVKSYGWAYRDTGRRVQTPGEHYFSPLKPKKRLASRVTVEPRTPQPNQNSPCLQV